MQTDSWTEIAFGSSAELSAFADRARSDLQLVEYQHDPEWLTVDESDDEKVAVVARESGGRLVGVVSARVARHPIEHTVGGYKLFRRPVVQYTVHQGPVCSYGDLSAASDGLRALGALPSDAAIYLSAVPTGSALHDLICDRSSALHAAFRVLVWGRPSTHFKISWEGSVETYLASLASKTKRKNVRRASQRLAEEARLKTKRFQSADEADAFLADASAISAKTYQSRDLGLSITAGRRNLIRWSARRGAFLGYVLYFEEIPVAFRYGFIYASTLFAVGTGYDPAHEALAPGSVLFFTSLSDIERIKLPISTIDFMPHENSFKRDRANVSIEVNNCYLFPRTFSGLALWLPLATVETINRLGRRATRRAAASNQ